jgi:hypothetical protein
MTEQELIKKIKVLKQIRPRRDWVVLTKSQILGQEPKRSLAPFGGELFSWSLETFPRLFLRPRPVLVSLIFLGILITAVFGFAQNALPGDSLYSLKRISEKSRVVFVSETNKPKAHLELANKRLEELTKIATTNQTEKLASALSEVQASVSQAAKDLKKPKKITKEIVDQTKKLEENKGKVEALGVLIGETEKLDNALSQLVEREIQDLEGQTLSEEKTRLLEQVKEDFEAGNFSDALEKIWLLSQSQ